MRKKYVTIEWFRRLFTVHGTERRRVVDGYDEHGDPIYKTDPETGEIVYEGDDDPRIVKPNDMDHEITDTESMFGTWTEHWLSALGIGSGSGGSGGGGGGDALDEPLLSINQMVATPTTAGQTLVWKGIGLGINGSGWDFDTAGMSQQEIQTLFDSRYLKLTSQSPQSVTSDITLNGLLTINHAQGFDPTSDQVGNNVVLTKGETLTLLDGRYVTVAFWNSLFETYNGNSQVNVNTENPIINNLKILVGTWTESYVSALGIGSGGSGGGGVWYLSQLEDVDHNSTPSNGDALVWDGQQWTFDTAGLNENELGQYLSTNKYIKADSNTKWWGRTMNNGVVKGDIDMALGDSIGWSLTGTSSPLSMVTLKTESSDRLFILGEGTTVNNNRIPTYLRGSSIYFQTISGNIDASLTKPASGDAIFYVKKLQIGSIVISEDTTNHAIHVEQNGLYADTYVSSLGTGSGGNAAGMDLEAMWTALGGTYQSNEQISASHLANVTKTLTLKAGGQTYTYNGIRDVGPIDVGGTIAGATDFATYFNANTITAKQAAKWASACNIKIASSDGSGEGAAVGVDGSEAKTLLLPSTIKATLTGNADTATKLKTARTLWGNSFDGSQSIGYVDNNNTAHYANLNFVGSITMNSSITGCTSIDSLAYFFTTEKQLRVSSSKQSTAYTYSSSGSTKTPRLHVDGNVSATGEVYLQGIDFAGYSNSDTTKNHGGYLDFNYGAQTSYDYTTRIIESSNGVLSIIKRSGATGLVIGGNSSATKADYIKIGGATITWDNTNQALHIDKGVYSDTYVSALGIGSGGGGGGGMTEDQMWVALGTNGQAKQITLTHLTLALNGYAKTADVTKKLTIHQEGQDDIEYNGTAAREITISAGGFEMKSVTNATLKGLSGTFGFYGQNLPDGDTRNYDWVGIQVGTTNDKWQLMADSGHLMIRQNDAGGSSSTGWVPVSSVESSGWYTVLDSGNYTSYFSNTYLPKSGGTMKGTIAFGAENNTSYMDVRFYRNSHMSFIAPGGDNLTISYRKDLSITNADVSLVLSDNSCAINSPVYSGGGRLIGPIAAGNYDFNFADGITTGGVYQLHIQQATQQQNSPFYFGVLANFVCASGHLQIAASDTKNDIKIRSYWWTGNKNFGSYPEWQTLIHSGNVGTYLSGSYVDLSTNQSIAGTKTFLSGITMVSDIKPNVHKQYYVGKSDAAFLEMNANRYNTTAGGGYTHRFQTDSDGYGGLSVHGTDINALFVYVSPTKQVVLGNSKLGAGLRFYGSNSVFYAVKDGTITECLRTLKSGNVCITNGISTDPGYKLYVDGTGGFTNKVTVIGNGFASKHTRDTSSALNGLEWQNTSGVCQACIQHHNTVQRVFINTTGASDVWNDAVGKYSLLIGNNELKYNTYNILHTNNGVTLDTTQDISGAKSFTSDIRCKKSNASIYVCQMSGASEIKKVGLNSDTNRGVWDFSYGAWLIGNNGTNTFLNVGSVGIGTTSPSAKLHVDGSGYFSSSIGIAGIDQYHALYVNGNTRFGGLVGIGTTAQSGYSLYVNGASYFNGDVNITKGKTIYFQHTASGVPEISIGTKSNDQNLYLKGINLYFNSSIINSSDMRLKDVDELVDGDIESIARAPIFYYRWKKTPEFGLHLGSSAQYWQNVFSCAVIKDGEGYLGLDYSATALASAVITARKVLDHEGEIKALRKRIGELEQEIETLKAA